MESNLPEANSATIETNTTMTETNAAVGETNAFISETEAPTTETNAEAVGAEAGPAIAEEGAAEVSSATEAKPPENSLPEVPVDKPVTKFYSTSLLWLFEVELLNERVTEEIRLLCTIKKEHRRP